MDESVRKHDLDNVSAQIDGQEVEGVVATFRTSEVARWVRFDECWENTRRPSGIIVKTRYQTYDVGHARNLAIRYAQKLNAKWVWLLDDDQTWEPNLLVNLLNRKVDIVQPLTLMRMAPWLPVGFKGKPGDELGMMVLQKDWEPLEPVLVSGGGCLLIRQKVWEAIEAPWFRPGYATSGRGTQGEDTAFGVLANERGFTVYLDTENVCGHITSCEIRPARDASGEWLTQLVFPDQTLNIPPAVHAGPKDYKIGF